MCVADRAGLLREPARQAPAGVGPRPARRTRDAAGHLSVPARTRGCDAVGLTTPLCGAHDAIFLVCSMELTDLCKENRIIYLLNSRFVRPHEI